jgi:hypothetical protein
MTRRYIHRARELVGEGLGGTIRNMHLAQPAPTELIATVWERNDQPKAFSDRTTVIANPCVQYRDGVRLDLILAKVDRMFDEHDVNQGDHSMNSLRSTSMRFASIYSILS